MSEHTPSGYDTPLTAMFEMQRTAIEVGQAVLEESVSAQREATAHVREITHTQEALQRQTLALSWAGVHDSLNLVTGSVPGRTHAIDDARQRVDEMDAGHASRVGDVDGAAADESSSTIEVLTDPAEAPEELADDGVESSIGAAETLTEPSTEVAETVDESSRTSSGEDEHTDRLG